MHTWFMTENFKQHIEQNYDIDIIKTTNIMISYQSCIPSAHQSIPFQKTGKTLLQLARCKLSMYRDSSDIMGLNCTEGQETISTTTKKRRMGEQFTYCLSAASLTSVPPYSGRRTVSPSFRATGISLPSLSRSPGPTATTLAAFSCNQSKIVK